MPEDFPIIILLVAAGCIFLHATRNLLGFWLKLALALITVMSCALYSDFGTIHVIFPHDKAYKEKYGNAPKHVLYHWHENYHYYLGAKYFPELGYKGLYETVALADKESPDPVIRAVGMRSLRAPTTHITMSEALNRGRTEFRPKFTDERWAEFTDDVETFKSVADHDWLDIGLFDAGYNPPPSWAVIGHTVANLIPISEKEAWGDDQRPDWYQLEWSTIFDPIWIIVSVGCIIWAFGGVAAAAFLTLFFLNEPASFGWIAGGFFRYTWLGELIIGLCCLKKQKYTAAGIFLGLSAVDRIFPAAFLAAGGLAVFAQNFREKNFRPTINMALGALGAISVMFGISVLMFGISAWQEFFEKILTHKDLYFVNHIGYRRIAVFGPDVPNQNFWWEPGLDRFRVWNANLMAKWDAAKPRHMVLWAVLIVSAVFASLRARADEAALMLGGLVFFLNEIAANYYYIYFPMVFVVLLTANYTRLRTLLMVAFLLLWEGLWRAHYMEPDELINNYYKCCMFFAFFCLWVMGRAGETLMWVLRERQPKVLKTP